jgi:hypothetical protein
MLEILATSEGEQGNALLGRTILRDFRSESACFRVCDFAWDRSFADVWDIDTNVVCFVLSSKSFPWADPDPRPRINPARQIMF